MVSNPGAGCANQRSQVVHPLPKGEGRGEGEGNVKKSIHAVQGKNPPKRNFALQSRAVHGEGAASAAMVSNPGAGCANQRSQVVHPLPKGEGRGEGEGNVKKSIHAVQGKNPPKRNFALQSRTVHGEGAASAAMVSNPGAGCANQRSQVVHPLPKGEGRGEGEGNVKKSIHAVQGKNPPKRNFALQSRAVHGEGAASAAMVSNPGAGCANQRSQVVHPLPKGEGRGEGEGNVKKSIHAVQGKNPPKRNFALQSRTVHGEGAASAAMVSNPGAGCANQRSQVVHPLPKGEGRGEGEGNVKKSIHAVQGKNPPKRNFALQSRAVHGEGAASAAMVSNPGAGCANQRSQVVHPLPKGEGRGEGEGNVKKSIHAVQGKNPPKRNFALQSRAVHGEGAASAAMVSNPGAGCANQRSQVVHPLPKGEGRGEGEGNVKKSIHAVQGKNPPKRNFALQSRTVHGEGAASAAMVSNPGAGCANQRSQVVHPLPKGEGRGEGEGNVKKSIHAVQGKNPPKRNFALQSRAVHGEGAASAAMVSNPGAGCANQRSQVVHPLPKGEGRGEGEGNVKKSIHAVQGKNPPKRNFALQSRAVHGEGAASAAMVSNPGAGCANQRSQVVHPLPKGEGRGEGEGNVKKSIHAVQGKNPPKRNFALQSRTVHGEGAASAAMVSNPGAGCANQRSQVVHPLPKGEGRGEGEGNVKKSIHAVQGKNPPKRNFALQSRAVHGEGAASAAMVSNPGAGCANQRSQVVHPLPKGEGRGEGEGNVKKSIHAVQGKNPPKRNFALQSRAVHGEGAASAAMVSNPGAGCANQRSQVVHPLPKGEGRGEGEGNVKKSIHAVQGKNPPKRNFALQSRAVHGEGAASAAMVSNPGAGCANQRSQVVHPLPKGEGRGEG